MCTNPSILKMPSFLFLYPLQTVRFKNELERNITIKLGYANAKIYKSEDDRCPRPMCYKYAATLEEMSFVSYVYCWMLIMWLYHAELMEVERKTVLFVMCQDLKIRG